MAFVLSDFARQTVGLNSGAVTADAVVYGGPAMFSYRSAADEVATIAAANYFANVVYKLSLSDLIYVVGSDAIGMYVVDALDRAAGTVTVAAASLTGVVNTANIADGAVTNVKVDAAAAIAYSKLAALPSAEVLVGSAGNVATAVAMSGDIAINNAGATAIQAGAVDLAMLSTGITPSHVVKFAGQPTSVGGAAGEAFTVTGIAATDLAFVQIVSNGTGNVTVLEAVCTLDTLTITFSGDPGADTIFNYQILRATA